MPNLNKCFLMGNLTRSPELRTTGGNASVAEFGIAINRKWANKQTGEVTEEVTFVDCTAWGKAAETLARYVAKGDPLMVEGRLTLDQWKDKATGSNRSKLKVTVEGFQFLGAPGGKDRDNTGGDEPPPNF